MRVVVERLGKTYHDRQGRDVVALRQVDFAVETREFVALLGPSGCGKSTLLGIIAGLLPATSGRVYFEGEPRPGQAPVTATVFQEFALFPWRTVRANVEFGLEELGIVGAERAERTRRYLDMTGLVGFEGKYPHQLSGGMRQRVVGAMAIAAPPRLLIADEPTTSLDLTIQAQYLGLLEELQERHRLALVFVTHNLGIVARICDRVAVMYAGRIVEMGPVRRLFTRPAHPYSRALLESIPRLGARAARLTAIEGQPPDLARLPAGCAFAPRCPSVMDRCRVETPPETVVEAGHVTRCWLEAPGAGAPAGGRPA